MSAPGGREGPPGGPDHWGVCFQTWRLSTVASLVSVGRVPKFLHPGAQSPAVWVGLAFFFFFFFFSTFQGPFEGNCVLFASTVLHSPAEDNSREHVEGGARDSVDKRGPGLLSQLCGG